MTIQLTIETLNSDVGHLPPASLPISDDDVLAIVQRGVTTRAHRSDVVGAGGGMTSHSADYTFVSGDANTFHLHPSADTTARTFTIPANDSVAFPIGTALTIVNQNAAGVVTIAITTDTMRLAGAGTTGSRTLAANGICTAIKLTATEWLISGGSALT